MTDLPKYVLISGPDHSYQWALLKKKKVVKSDYSRGFIYKYVGDEYVEEGFHVSEEWVAE